MLCAITNREIRQQDFMFDVIPITWFLTSYHTMTSPLLLFVVLLALVDSFSSSSCNVSIAVWDNVLSTDSQQCLHRVCSQQGSSQHYLFSRPLAKENQNVLERSIDSILTELGDESTYVEYWTRQEWRSIEAHADVDEFLAKKEDAEGKGTVTSFRYPVNGHVLYLQKGSQVRGPTCVFPGRRSGGELLREGNDIEVVTVPAVPGRLLRFRGDYLHAVPRPTDLWFLKFIQGANKYDPEEEWGRSVVLFNTWGEDSPSDVTVNTDYTTGEKECGCEPNSEWSESYILKQSEKSCQVIKDDGMIGAKIWLLGNERRRDHPMRTLKLLAPEDLRVALSKESAVSRYSLKKP